MTSSPQLSSMIAEHQERIAEHLTVGKATWSTLLAKLAAQEERQSRDYYEEQVWRWSGMPAGSASC